MPVESIKWFSPADPATRALQQIPAWVTDEAVRQSIADGFIDIPDDLLRGPR